MQLTQRIVAVLVVTGVLVIVTVLFRTAISVPYAPLFTGLDPKDAGKITEDLKQEKIPYRLANQGQTIEVPEKLVYDTRISLASSGALYSSGVGFELFDQTKFGVTEFEQQVGYQRALQEELRRTIVQIEGVDQARVHLVLPKKSLFIEEQTAASASIAIKLKPAARITSENVRGIVELVAGSVEGLKPENIHIIDMDGNSLSDDLRFGDKSLAATEATMDRYLIRRNFEKELETRIQGMLSQILGQGKAVAMVSAELDFDQLHYKSTTYDKGAVYSEQSITESGTSGAGGSAGGVPGTGSELPGISVPSAGGGQSSGYSRQESTINYQVPNKEETVIKAPGELKKLSASVVLNGNYSEFQLRQIQSVVATAIGFNDERGDQITVSSMTFDTAEQKEIGAELAKQKAQEEERNRYITLAGVAIGSLLVVIVLISYMVRQLRKRSHRIEELRKREEERRLQEEAEERQRGELPKIATKADEARRMAVESPDDVAEVLKLWLKE